MGEKKFFDAEINSKEDVETLRAGGAGLTAQIDTALAGLKASYVSLVAAFQANDSAGIASAKASIGEFTEHLDSIGGVILKASAFEASQAEAPSEEPAAPVEA